ncbi:esterase-like activity of phytase family protein [Cocleimonas flava]|uniref:Phytase-like domain-containing protein n=1 Tax=Cocleimonas flava TaxID=634765 RepID=A0A4R1F5E7_9GAMM|nr:esterase-like activity of phytase family protein [Cocleimonas flava]TCJ87844.1 hypothetical protein EV695_2360 [Cocleimonas flava]
MRTYTKLKPRFQKNQNDSQNEKQKPLKNSIQWLISFFIGFSSLLLFSCSSGQTNPNSYPIAITPKHIDTDFMQLKLNGSIALKPSTFNTIPVQELSGIAWDNDEKLLYAVSDEGYFYHIKVSLKNNQLDAMQVVYAARLTDSEGIPLKGKHRDSEGLSTLNTNNGKPGDTQLIISFENKPRIEKFSTKGRMISTIKLPKKIRKKNKFSHKNKALESVTYHPKYGVITAAEYPIKNRDDSIQTVFSSKGKEWNFERSKAPNSAITGLEVLANGDLLVLERAYKNPITPVVINLRRLQLDQCNTDRLCKTQAIARFDAADDWSIDNFEGLAHYKDNQYFMISDDNNNIFQKTILVFFEVIDAEESNKK